MLNNIDRSGNCTLIPRISLPRKEKTNNSQGHHGDEESEPVRVSNVRRTISMMSNAMLQQQQQHDEHHENKVSPLLLLSNEARSKSHDYQFFINIKDNVKFDQLGYTPFGYVIFGMDNIDGNVDELMGDDNHDISMTIEGNVTLMTKLMV